MVGLALGADHTCVLSAAGAVRCWGANQFGQLGYGNTVTLGDDETAAVTGPVSAQGVRARFAAGDFHTCAVTRSHALRCWGRNHRGQLGLGNTNDVGDDELPSSLATVSLGAGALQVVAGAAHTCALLTTGAVRCWGEANAGQLGLGNGQVVGDNELPTAVGVVQLGEKATFLAAGRYHTCALLSSGAVRCWGHGLYGQLGGGLSQVVGDDEIPASRPVVSLGEAAQSLAAGQYHTCALLSSGAVRCWGYGLRGALGLGDTRSLGDDELPTSVPPVSLGAAAIALELGDEHSCAVLSDHTLRCWGLGAGGRLGLGDTLSLGDQQLPTSRGPIPLPGAVWAIGAGRAHTCALLHDAMYCWGQSESGQLGLGRTPPVGDDEPLNAVMPVSFGTL